jgi:hypothetical protein
MNKTPKDGYEPRKLKRDYKAIVKASLLILSVVAIITVISYWLISNK